MTGVRVSVGKSRARPGFQPCIDLEGRRHCSDSTLAWKLCLVDCFLAVDPTNFCGGNIYGDSVVVVCLSQSISYSRIQHATLKRTTVHAFKHNSFPPSHLYTHSHSTVFPCDGTPYNISYTRVNQYPLQRLAPGPPHILPNSVH